MALTPPLEGRIDIGIINVYCHNSKRPAKTHVICQALFRPPTEPWSGGSQTSNNKRIILNSYGNKIISQAHMWIIES